MRLGYNTNGLQNHRLVDALHLLADREYRAVALTLDVMHLDPLHTTPGEVAKIARLLSELDLKPVIETGARFLLDPACKHEPTLMTRAPMQRERRLDFFHHAAAIGRDLGAEVLSFFSGVDREQGDQEAAHSWLLEGIVRACDLVRRHGLVPALEPEPGMAIGTVADYQQVVTELGDEAPMLCLDVGHLHVTGEADLDSVLLQQKERIVQVHLEDIRKGVHEHLPPGQGEVDFAAVRRAFEAVGYEGTVCFELSRSSHMAPTALDLCRSVWQQRA